MRYMHYANRVLSLSPIMSSPCSLLAEGCVRTCCVIGFVHNTPLWQSVEGSERSWFGLSRGSISFAPEPPPYDTGSSAYWLVLVFLFSLFHPSHELLGSAWVVEREPLLHGCVSVLCPTCPRMSTSNYVWRNPPGIHTVYETGDSGPPRGDARCTSD